MHWQLFCALKMVTATMYKSFFPANGCIPFHQINCRAVLNTVRASLKHSINLSLAEKCCFFFWNIIIYSVWFVGGCFFFHFLNIYLSFTIDFMHIFMCSYARVTSDTYWKRERKMWEDFFIFVFFCQFFFLDLFSFHIVNWVWHPYKL